MPRLSRVNTMPETLLEAITSTGEARPWGSFDVLKDCHHYKLKQLIVKAGKRLSLQLHHYREEHWLIVKGNPEITVEDKTWIAKPGEYVYIPFQAKHRLSNPGHETVEVIEIQMGSSFSEDDIIRFQDDFDRV